MTSLGLGISYCIWQIRFMGSNSSSSSSSSRRSSSSSSSSNSSSCCSSSNSSSNGNFIPNRIQTLQDRSEYMSNN